METTQKERVYDDFKCKRLNFNIKFEIITFLPIHQIFDTIFLLDKTFFMSLKKRKIMTHIAENKKLIENEISFTKENIKEILGIFKDSKESKTFLKQICAYFLYKKFRFIKRWNLDSFNGSIDIKVFSFYMAMSNIVDEIYLDKSGIRKKEKYLRIFSNACAKNTKLKAFGIREEIGLNDLDMLYISRAITPNINLQELNFSNNLIGKNKTDFVYLAIILKENKNLTKIDLKENKLFENSDKDNFDLFCKELQKHKNLKAFRINGNSIIDNQYNFCNLVQSLEKSENMNSVNLAECDIGLSEQGLTAVSNLLKNGIISSIFLSSNELGRDDNHSHVINILENISKNPNLRFIRMDENKLSTQAKIVNLIKTIQKKIDYHDFDFDDDDNSL